MPHLYNVAPGNQPRKKTVAPGARYAVYLFCGIELTPDRGRNEKGIENRGESMHRAREQQRWKRGWRRIRSRRETTRRSARRSRSLFMQWILPSHGRLIVVMLAGLDTIGRIPMVDGICLVLNDTPMNLFVPTVEVLCDTTLWIQTYSLGHSVTVTLLP